MLKTVSRFYASLKVVLLHRMFLKRDINQYTNGNYSRIYRIAGQLFSYWFCRLAAITQSKIRGDV